MRQLTQKEINEAPELMTHYCIDDKDVVRFEHIAKPHGLDGLPWYLDGVKFNPIPSKEFDIMDYEFDDPILSVSESSKEAIAFHCYTRESMTFTREDWIAGAKHFKLTAEDLK